MKLVYFALGGVAQLKTQKTNSENLYLMASADATRLLVLSWGQSAVAGL